jgi:hypothetical protein
MNRRKSDKGTATISDYLVWILLGMLIAAVGYVAFLAFYPRDPIRIDSMPINKTQACRGERVCFQILGEKFYPVPVRVSVELVNGEGIAIVNYISNHPPGSKFPQRCFNVPYHVEPGKHRIRWTGVYEMNSFQHVVKKMMSEPITIVPSPKMLKGDKGDHGDKGIKGDKGDRGAKGGVSFFGEGKQGPKGDPGKPGKSCVGTDCK